MRRFSLVTALYLSTFSTLAHAQLMGVSYPNGDDFVFACVRVVPPGQRVEKVPDEACAPNDRALSWTSEKVATVAKPLPGAKPAAYWSASTPVATSRGPVELSSLKPGDYVIAPTPDGRLQPNAVVEVREVPVTLVAYVELETESGASESVYVSLDSQVYSVKEGAWKPVYESVGQTVLHNLRVREGGAPHGHRTAVIRQVVVEHYATPSKSYALVLKDKSRPYYFAGGLLTRGPL